jgi:hypothetical protein
MVTRRVQRQHYIGGIGKAAKIRRYAARLARRYGYQARPIEVTIITPEVSPNVPAAEA